MPSQSQVREQCRGCTRNPTSQGLGAEGGGVFVNNPCSLSQLKSNDRAARSLRGWLTVAVSVVPREVGVDSTTGTFAKQSFVRAEVMLWSRTRFPRNGCQSCQHHARACLSQKWSALVRSTLRSNIFLGSCEQNSTSSSVFEARRRHSSDRAEQVKFTKGSDYTFQHLSRANEICRCTTDVRPRFRAQVPR